MSDWLQSQLLLLSDRPVAAALLIILATFVLEDAATIGAGMLAVSGIIPFELALGSLYAGIVLGDMALYGLGRLAKMTGWSRFFVSTRSLVQGRRWLRKRLVPALIGARFTPGMRTPTFMASGFLKLSFLTFIFTILIVAAVWTSLLFTVIYVFGDIAARIVGDKAWIFGIVLIVSVIVLPIISQRRLAAAAATGNKADNEP